MHELKILLQFEVVIIIHFIQIKWHVLKLRNKNYASDFERYKVIKHTTNVDSFFTQLKTNIQVEENDQNRSITVANKTPDPK